jgi:hypothetical protein
VFAQQWRFSNDLRARYLWAQQAKSPKPKQNILLESGRSVRTILEGAASNATAEGSLAMLRILFGG